MSKTDKRHCQAKIKPMLTACRGGIKMVLTGKNTHGKPASVTVFIDNSFLPGIIGDIRNICRMKQVDAIALLQRVKEAANG
jgi:hypothetical protein